MKKIKYLFVALIAIMAIACEKETDSSPVPASFLYFSAWRDTGFGKIDLLNGYSVSYLAKGAASGFTDKGVLGIDYNPNTGDFFLTLERDNGKIYKLTPSGTLSVLFDETDGVDNPTAIIYNTANGKLYWINSGDEKILVGNADGSGAPSSLFGSTSIDASGYGMAINYRDGKIYYTNWDAILVGNLNGIGTPVILYDYIADTVESPSSIVLDVENNKIYWTDEATDNVAAGNLDGTGNIQFLFTNAADGVDRSDGLAIDKVSNKIYWTETGSNHRIRMGNLDGSGSPTLLLNDVECYILRLR